jgi:multidrug efflux system outer membrane protein
LAQAVKAAQSSTDIAEAQYKVGLTTYLNVLNARASLLSAEDKLIQSRQAEIQNLIAVYKALGGGWHEAPEETAQEARGILNLPRGP